MDDNKLPVEILDKELPKDDNKDFKVFDDDSKSYGFADVIFLGGIMMVCFMWGMLVILLR